MSEITKKTFYGSGRFYTVTYDADTFPMPEDPKNITEQEMTALAEYLTDHMTEDYQIGYLKNGYQFNLATNKLSDKSDLGEMKIDVINEETATVQISLFNANVKTIADQYPTARNCDVNGYSVTTVGGLANLDETPKVLIFKHDDNKHGNTLCVCIGKNTSGFDAVWKQDAITPFTVKYDVEPLDDKGDLVMFIDCPVSTLGALTVTSAAGTNTGDTKITVSPAKAAGNSYRYKVGDSAASVSYGQSVSSWTAWNGSADITAATGSKITVVEADSGNKAVKAGSATVTAKA